MIAVDKDNGTKEEVVMASFKVYSDILSEGINQITKNHHQDRWCFSWGLSLESPKYRLSQLAPWAVFSGFYSYIHFYLEISMIPQMLTWYDHEITEGKCRIPMKDEACLYFMRVYSIDVSYADEYLFSILYLFQGRWYGRDMYVKR